MNQNARAWLPVQALHSTAIETAVKGIVESWVDEWMATSPSLDIESRAKVLADGPRDEIGDDQLAIDLSHDSMTAIGAACAALAPSALTTRKDHLLCAAVGRAAIDDMVERLRQSFERPAKDLSSAFPAATSQNKRHRLHFVETSRAWEFFIDASDTAMIAIRRTSARPALPMPPIQNDALSNALSVQPIDFGAQVGTTRLPIAATRELAIGDVLLLDRTTGDAMPIAVDGRSMTTGAVRLRALASGVAMEIAEPLHTQSSLLQ